MSPADRVRGGWRRTVLIVVLAYVTVAAFAVTAWAGGANRSEHSGLLWDFPEDG